MRIFAGLCAMFFALELCAAVVVVDTSIPMAADSKIVAELTSALKLNYTRIAEILDGADSASAPDTVRLTFREGDGVAYASGGTITVFLPWMRHNPQDTGVVIHEAVHIIQRYPRGAPMWVTEGIADYVRFARFEPNGMPDRVWKHEHYTNGYRVTARFFEWIEKTHKVDLIRPLNKACRAGKYAPAIFKELTGKTLDDLWKTYNPD